MRSLSRTSALAAGIVAATFGFAASLSAQGSPAKADSGPHFSLFGGTAASESSGPENGVELGASGDFRWAPIPVPLRLSLSFSQRHDDRFFSMLRGGKASLDLVMRPIPKKLGIQPYFLGGIGLATRAPSSGVVGGRYVSAAAGRPAPLLLHRPPRAWA